MILNISLDFNLIFPMILNISLVRLNDPFHNLQESTIFWNFLELLLEQSLNFCPAYQFWNFFDIIQGKLHFLDSLSISVIHGQNSLFSNFKFKES